MDSAFGHDLRMPSNRTIDLHPLSKCNVYKPPYVKSEELLGDKLCHACNEASNSTRSHPSMYKVKVEMCPTASGEQQRLTIQRSKMLCRLLLPLAILTAYTAAKPPPPPPPPPPPVFNVYEGKCGALQKGLGSVSFDPFGGKDMPCYSIQGGTGTVLWYANTPADGFPCTGQVWNNNGCNDDPNTELDGGDGPTCVEGGPFYSVKVHCHGGGHP
ncbi:hypothetical protein EJ03DRAFT_164074 [Teratosphaeria nubilosa]|uniref:Uncharacterized protein n=1 Tax=Teratosphaeria nubilosa TaxID=161662 RepID=A0A6G1L2F9_9PEZI|nr:hypothetical protein EJ03DRAFT_164074 [Teratosphaeria nubilosa]